MASYRKLPSGRWQATVYLPDGTRTTETDPLKNVVKNWAIDLEARLKRGEVHNPRDGKVRIGQRYEQWRQASGLNPITLRKIDSLWATHCQPRWAKAPMDSIGREDAQVWVNKLKSTKRARHQGRDTNTAGSDVPFIGASTVCEAVHLMTGLYNHGMAARPPWVLFNPFAGLKLPTIPPGEIIYFEREEAEALYRTVGRRFGHKWETLIRLGTDAGQRPGELFGLHAHRVRLGTGLIKVEQVMTRDGLRDYPKSMMSFRQVPIPDHSAEGLERLRRGLPMWEVPCSCPKALPDGTTLPGKGPCPGLVFPAARGGPIDDGNFRDRIWYPSVEAARLCGNFGSEEATKNKAAFAAGRCGPYCDDPMHRIRRFPPRAMRHTSASMLVQDGVPLYDVQLLLGHEDFRTTQKYAHLAPGRHDAVRESWKKRDHARSTHRDQKAVSPIRGNGL